LYPCREEKFILANAKKTEKMRLNCVPGFSYVDGILFQIFLQDIL
jgi:hypothetical protein